MTSKADKEVIEDEKAAEKAYQRRRKKGDDGVEVDDTSVEQQQTQIDPVPAGGNEPNTLPPSVVGTEQDPKRKDTPKPEEE